MSLAAAFLTAAQQAYANIQQDFQNRTAPTEGHRHHHHHHGGGGSSSFSQLLSQLGQALGSGNLSKAQPVFPTLQQDFEQWGQSDGHSQPPQSSSTASSASGS